MTALSIQRVLTLPQELAASTMYIVASTEGLVDLVFTNAAGTASRSTVSKELVESMITNGVAGQADQLTIARLISITGDATWEVSFDGSGDVTAALELATVNTVDGQAEALPVVTIDSKGRVLDSRALTNDDLPTINGSKIGSAISVDTTGNAATATLAESADEATRLATARTINGVAFDGTANITINAVDATPRIAVSEKGVANGVATLDASGLVPSSQLPSYVDDVVEAANFAALPETGESSKIYVTLDNNYVYRWTGSTYIQIPGGVGLSDAAVKLATAREIALTGMASGSVLFDGTQDVSIQVELEQVDHPEGEQGPVVTTDVYGRVIGSRALVAADIPTLDYTKVASAASIELAASEW